jgi:hypothetical protein
MSPLVVLLQQLGLSNSQIIQVLALLLQINNSGIDMAAQTSQQLKNLGV